MRENEARARCIYIANFHFDDLTVAVLAALAPPITIVMYMQLYNRTYKNRTTTGLE